MFQNCGNFSLSASFAAGEARFPHKNGPSSKKVRGEEKYFLTGRGRGCYIVPVYFPGEELTVPWGQTPRLPPPLTDVVYFTY